MGFSSGRPVGDWQQELEAKKEESGMVIGSSLMARGAAILPLLASAVAALTAAPPLAAGVFTPDPLGLPDPALRVELDAIAEELGIADLGRSGRASLVLVDLTGSIPVHAGIAADSTLGAASVAKLAVLLGAFAEAFAGKIELTTDLERDLGQMIRTSSNPEATRVIRRVGFPAIAAALHDPRHALHDPVCGGLWVGRDFSGGKVWRLEPRSREAHAASAARVARFYVLLDRGQLVSPKASEAMREILSVTTFDHKFVAGLRQAAGLPPPPAGKPLVIPGYRILRKSGSFGPWQADSALIESAGRRYVLVCLLADREGGEQRLRRLVAAVDRLIARRHAAAGIGGRGKE